MFLDTKKKVLPTCSNVMLLLLPVLCLKMLALRKQPNGSSRTCWDASISSSVFATRVITSKTLKYVEYSRIQIKNMHMFLKYSTLPTALFLIFRSETFMSCYLGSTEPMLGMLLCSDPAVMRESGVLFLGIIYGHKFGKKCPGVLLSV